MNRSTGIFACVGLYITGSKAGLSILSVVWEKVKQKLTYIVEFLYLYDVCTMGDSGLLCMCHF